MRQGSVTNGGGAMAGNSTNGTARLLARHVMRVSDGVGPVDTLARAASLMESVGIRELPVLKGRTLIGILTRSDMEPYRGHFEWTTVASAMTPGPITVGPEAPLDDVMGLLVEHGFNGVPVTAGEELLGMIARTDILRALARTD
jgi:CBS domain-containing protein